MRKRRNKSDILIDLTSLLDVVFIVLLVVVFQLQSTKQAVAQGAKDIEAAQTELESTQELYNDQINSLNNISEYVVFISVNARFEQDLTTRHIEVMCSDPSSVVPEIAEIKGMSVAEGYGDLRAYLQGYISENPDKTVVLSLNEGDEDILYRDEKAIKNMFDDLSSEYLNIKQK